MRFAMRLVTEFEEAGTLIGVQRPDTPTVTLPVQSESIVCIRVISFERRVFRLPRRRVEFLCRSKRHQPCDVKAHRG